ncbi:MAG: hypothetical protein AMXMBFR84_06350 [Candidatus Hydrogenedentota bacterium]
MVVLKTSMRYLMAVLFVAAGANHFINPDFYIQIMPTYLPFPRALVLLSGLTEIAGGVMLCFRKTAVVGAWSIVAMLVVFFLVHIDMIIHADRYPSMPMWGLVLRLLLQFLLIAWACWFTRPVSNAAATIFDRQAKQEQ